MNIVMIDNDYNFCDKLANFLKSNGDLYVIKSFCDINEAIEYIKDNKFKFELLMVDLEVQNININVLLETISNNCNVLAFSEKDGTLDKYINFPYFQRIFKKPISFSVILNYISIQNGIETFENYRKNVLKILAKLGFNINHAGTMYLVDGITLAIKNKFKKLSDIYTLVAYNHDTDPKIVGWSINNAINKAMKSCEIDKLQSFFHIQNNQKLTAKYIISHFLNYDLSSKN